MGRLPFGSDARLRRLLAPQLAAGETIQATARDAVFGDHWAITDRQLLHLSRDRSQLQAVSLVHLIGEVRHEASGLTVRVRSSRDLSVTLLGAFRKPNDFTRRIQAAVDHHHSDEPETG